jgi:hypothetical protein
MAKKKFLETKVGRFLTSNTGKSIVGLIPFGVGSMLSNVLNKVNDSNPGQVETNALKIDLIKIAIYLVLGVLVAKGVFSQEDIEVIKNTIEGVD